MSHALSDVAEAAARAASIVMDASERLVVDADTMFMTQARLGKPYRGAYETKSGRQIEVPNVSDVLSETAPWKICVYAKDAIERSHRNSHTTDGSALRATFGAFAGFQRLCIGLRVLNRYFAPSCFTRSDNLFEAVEFQLESIDSAVKGISSKPTYGPEYGDETGERLAALAKSLRATLEAVEWEMAAFPSYAGCKANTPSF
ncbi:RNA-binding protein [Pararhizobium sp. BT-229]|uniref:RNA-binding protein n=1 Tax=Pararhizobium sp. BT-229 TaxID=2986923 RepID=UPI0021F7AC87|nr:RNA-binding protein [Pararhizobium sp. BT-229]MCV9964039.1 RNA-binding protein [Pararhizobium sp. BT-229]